MLVQCPPAPGPLEDYCVHFGELFRTPAQRRGFREYLTGLLAPRDRNKTLTCLAGAEPVVGAQHAAVQRLQYFLSESFWDDEAVNAQRLELLLSGAEAEPASAAAAEPASAAAADPEEWANTTSSAGATPDPQQRPEAHQQRPAQASSHASSRPSRTH